MNLCLWDKRNSDRLPSCKLYLGLVAVIWGFEEYGFISWIQKGHGDTMQSFSSSICNNYILIRQSWQLFSMVVADGVMKLLCAWRACVLMTLFRYCWKILLNGFQIKIWRRPRWVTLSKVGRASLDSKRSHNSPNTRLIKSFKPIRLFSHCQSKIL